MPALLLVSRLFCGRRPYNLSFLRASARRPSSATNFGQVSPMAAGTLRRFPSLRPRGSRTWCSRIFASFLTDHEQREKNMKVIWGIVQRFNGEERKVQSMKPIFYLHDDVRHGQSGSRRQDRGARHCYFFIGCSSMSTSRSRRRPTWCVVTVLVLLLLVQVCTDAPLRRVNPVRKLVRMARGNT